MSEGRVALPVKALSAFEISLIAASQVEGGFAYRLEDISEATERMEPASSCGRSAQSSLNGGNASVAAADR